VVIVGASFDVGVGVDSFCICVVSASPFFYEVNYTKHSSIQKRLHLSLRRWPHIFVLWFLLLMGFWKYLFIFFCCLRVGCVTLYWVMDIDFWVPQESLSRWVRLRDGIAQSVSWLGYGLEERGSIPGRDFMSWPPCPDRLWGPPSLLSSGYRGALLPRVKRLGREVYHSPLSSAEIKNV
jgi:hypothetical protein